MSSMDSPNTESRLLDEGNFAYADGVDESFVGL